MGKNCVIRGCSVIRVLIHNYAKITNPGQLTEKVSPKLHILDSSKFKVFADDNCLLKFSKWVENTVGKGEIAHYEQFLLFTQYFQKTCTADT